MGKVTIMERQRLFILISIAAIAAVSVALFLTQDLAEPKPVEQAPNIPEPANKLGDPCKGRAIPIDDTICIDGTIQLID